MRQCEIRAQARAARSGDLMRHARAERRDRRLRARMRDGRTRGRAQARSARAAPALLFRARPEQRSALHQQGAARMLPPGRRGVRLGQAQSRAALDARRQRAGRLGHGDRRLGGVADADRRAHRADAPTAMPRSRAPPPTSAPAPTRSWRRSRPTCSGCRSTTSPSSSAIRRLPQSPVEGGSWIAASVSNAIATTADAIREELLRLAKRIPNSPLANAAPGEVTLADGEVDKQERRVALGVDRGRHAARRPWTASSSEKHHNLKATMTRARATRIRRSSPR